MTLVFPEAISSEGNVTLTFVPSLAAPAVPTATVLNGATALDMSCYIIEGGFSKESSQTDIEDRRFCSVQTYTHPGRTTESYGDVTYVYDPQAAALDVDNRAYATLTPGVTGYMVERYGIAVGTAYAALQKVDVYPVTWGVQRKQVPTGTEGEVLTVIQKPSITGPAFKDVAVA